MGDQKRDFIYIDDVVSINMFFMEESLHDIYNVGTGNAEPFNEIANNIFKYYKDEDRNFNYIEIYLNHQSFHLLNLINQHLFLN